MPETHAPAGAKKRDLVITRVFDAPVDQVWRAFVDPEFVMLWWGPHGFTCPVARMDVRVGGTSLVTMSSPEHGDHHRTWHYQEVLPMHRIEYIRKATDEDGNEVDPSTVGMPPGFPRLQRHAVALEAVGDNRTKLTFTEYDWSGGPMMELSKVGLEECLDKMAAIFTAHGSMEPEADRRPETARRSKE